MLVPSSKTEHHADKSVRIVPILDELRPYLVDAFEIAKDKTAHVIATHRNRNHRTRILKIIARAGLTAWPKAFHNLRASRQTELEDKFPSHVVCAWLGNSRSVAEKHYLQVTEEHFEKAALQNAQLSHPKAGGRRDHAPRNIVKKPQRDATRRKLTVAKVGDEGLEPPTSTV